LGSRQRLATSAAQEQPEEASDALKETYRSEQKEIVRRALADLPEEQRRTLLLAYFEGLTQSEIAAKINAPLGTVKTRMRSALIKLRETLGTQMGSLGQANR
jgi:RNA polymerase sigma-70 factor (ECF subfamily)